MAKFVIYILLVSYLFLSCPVKNFDNYNLQEFTDPRPIHQKRTEYIIILTSYIIQNNNPSSLNNVKEELLSLLDENREGFMYLEDSIDILYKSLIGIRLNIALALLENDLLLSLESLNKAEKLVFNSIDTLDYEESTFKLELLVIHEVRKNIFKNSP